MSHAQQQSMNHENHKCNKVQYNSMRLNHGQNTKKSLKSEEQINPFHYKCNKIYVSRKRRVYKVNLAIRYKPRNLHTSNNNVKRCLLQSQFKPETYAK